MRTTLDIDEDVLNAANELAARRKTTAGKIISDLARQALTRRSDADHLAVRDGFPVLPSTGKRITVEFIDKLLEEDI
jgi:hypothetical protein